MDAGNSAHLGAADRSFGLTITDHPNVPADSPYAYNRMETRIDVDLRGEYGAITRRVRLEIVDDLFALIDGLTAFTKRERMALLWCTSSESLEIWLGWNSSLDIRCRVRVGAARRETDNDAILIREDNFEVYEITFVVVLPQIDAFLEDLRAIALCYPPY